MGAINFDISARQRRFYKKSCRGKAARASVNFPGLQRENVENDVHKDWYLIEVG